MGIQLHQITDITASPDGHIINTITGREIPTRLNKQGYLMFRTYLKGRRRTILAARFVAFLYVGPPPIPSWVVRYRDGSPANIRSDNLYWAPHAGNRRRASAF